MDLTNILNNSSYDESRSSESEDNRAKNQHQRLRTPSPILEPPPVSTSPIRQQLRQQTDFLTTTTSPNNYTHRKPAVAPERVIRTRKSTRASSLASIASSAATTEAKTNGKLKRKQVEDSVSKDNPAETVQNKRTKKHSRSTDRDRSNSLNAHTSDEEPEEEDDEEGEEEEENSKSQQSKKDSKIKRNKAPNSSWSPEEDGKLLEIVLSTLPKQDFEKYAKLLNKRDGQTVRYRWKVILKRAKEAQKKGS